MPRMIPMNSFGPEAGVALTNQLSSVDPAIMEALVNYVQQSENPLESWNNSVFRELYNRGLSSQVGGEGYNPLYESMNNAEQGFSAGTFGGTGRYPTPSEDLMWAFNPTSINYDEQGTSGYALNPSSMNAIQGAPGSGLDFVPLDYVIQNEAAFRAIDPNFNIEQLQKTDHPAYGQVVLLGNLPQTEQTSGEMFQEMLSAAAMVAAGAAGISGFAGLHGMPGLESLFNLGASPTTGLDSFTAADNSWLGSGDLWTSEAIDTYLQNGTMSQGLNPTNYGYPSELSPDASFPESNTMPTTNTPYTPGGAEEIAQLTGGPGTATNALSSMPSWLRNLIQGLPSTVAQSVISNWVNNNLDDAAGDMIDDFDELNRFRTMGPEVSDLWRSTSGLDFAEGLMDRQDEFINPYAEQALTGFNAAANLVDDPGSHPGWGLAATAGAGLEQLYTDPMSNPIMEAVSRLTAENASRRSAAGRGLNAGSMPAEMQDALLAALSQNYANIANPMNQSVQAGSGFYTNDVNAATGLGTGAAQANYQSGANLGNLINAGNNTYNVVSGRVNSMAPRVNDSLQALASVYAPAFASRLNRQTPTQVSNSTAGNTIGSAISGATQWGLDWLSRQFT